MLAPGGLHGQCPDGSAPPCPTISHHTPPPNSVAVLYFDNLTRDSSYAYIADGLTEELISRLGQVRRLEVKSRFESRRVRGAVNASPSELGRTLNAAYILSGSVEAVSGRLRVTAELMRVRNKTRVWGDVLDGAGSDLLGAQQGIVTAVVRAVSGQLLPAESSVLARRATNDSAAYDLYLRAWSFLNRGRTGSDFQTAEDLFQQAVNRDSTFALGWAGLANAWAQIADAVLPPSEAYPYARRAAERALALDSTIAPAYNALAATALQVDYDFPRAESLARRAVALDPGFALGHISLAWVLIVRGKLLEALEESRRGWQLDSLAINVFYQHFHNLMDLARYKEVVSLSPRADLVMGPGVGTVLRLQALLAMHRCDDARAAYAKIPTPNVRPEIFFAACEGKPEHWPPALDTTAAKTLVADMGGNPQLVVGAFALIGQPDSAFAWLERAYVRRDYWVLTVNRPIWWNGWLQADPRFATFTRRVGLLWPVPELPPER